MKKETLIIAALAVVAVVVIWKLEFKSAPAAPAQAPRAPGGTKTSGGTTKADIAADVIGFANTLADGLFKSGQSEAGHGGGASAGSQPTSPLTNDSLGLA